ncbi:MAG: hypothetical protein RL329_3054 [Bacteroidota bacterium]|jgi:4-diphosphocytidyl-2C-methyl-D-erythritol kinase
MIRASLIKKAYHIRKKKLQSEEKKSKIEIFLRKRIPNAILKLESFYPIG